MCKMSPSKVCVDAVGIPELNDRITYKRVGQANFLISRIKITVSRTPLAG